MALRRGTALAGERARRPFAFALFLLLGAVLLVGPALAEEEAFSATVKVDATADGAAAAREVARIDGQRRALSTTRTSRRTFDGRKWKVKSAI